MTDALAKKQTHCEGFAPIVSGADQVLILGSMPSVRSLQEAFYYAHPRNAFWPILAACLDVPDLAQAQRQEKVATLQAHGIALWDVLAQCQRSGSLDAAIVQPVVNDFAVFFQTHNQIRQVLFNGQKAHQLFQRWVLPHQAWTQSLDCHVMPSTSPANARLSFENKRDFWCQTLSHRPLK